MVTVGPENLAQAKVEKADYLGITARPFPSTALPTELPKACASYSYITPELSRGMHHTSSYTHAHTTAFPFEEVFQASSSHKGDLVLLLSLINHRLDTEGFTRDRRQEQSPLENMEPSIQADTNQPSDPVDEEPVKVTRGKVVQSESLQNQEFLENKRFSNDRSNPNQSSYH
uniref:Uncharacterized protein n=1 Tax=Vespula pensylvanica TaxID=30213 RepID=A0A834P7R5_VESPE|nr:hypothetical protein H0235_004547 [Vespula pensylvanica]